MHCLKLLPFLITPNLHQPLLCLRWEFAFPLALGAIVPVGPRVVFQASLEVVSQGRVNNRTSASTISNRNSSLVNQSDAPRFHEDRPLMEEARGGLASSLLVPFAGLPHPSSLARPAPTQIRLTQAPSPLDLCCAGFPRSQGGKFPRSNFQISSNIQIPKTKLRTRVFVI